MYHSVGPQGLKGATVQTQAGPKQMNSTIIGLENGVKYAFYVEPVNKKFNRTIAAMATALPIAPCDRDMVPSAPANLTAFADGPGIKVCWKAPPQPTNGGVSGCVDEYRIAKKMVPLTEEEVKTATWQYQPQVTSAGCMTFPSLADRRSYQFAVQSYGVAPRAGSFASTQATVVRDWKCMPVGGYYPLCKSAAGGQCNPMTCGEQAVAGRCASLRTLDSTTKTIVQYCSDVCGCSGVVDAPTSSSVAVAAAAGEDISSQPAAESHLMMNFGRAYFEQPDTCCKASQPLGKLQ